MFNRFFSFGCSFTQHIWPTWANIIAFDLNIPFQNWGKSGAGNFAISSKIVECNFVNEFKDDDLIVVLWSTWQREDRYLDQSWQCHGSVFNNHIYDFDFIKKYWSMENDYIKNSVIIDLTQRAFNDKIKFEGSISIPHISGEEYHYSDKRIESEKLKKIKEIFYNNLKKPILFERKAISHRSYNDKCLDGHPDIMEHLNFVSTKIYPTLGLTLNQSTINFCKNYFDKAVDIIDYDDNYNDIVVKFAEINKSFNLDLTLNFGI